MRRDIYLPSQSNDFNHHSEGMLIGTGGRDPCILKLGASWRWLICTAVSSHPTLTRVKSALGRPCRKYVDIRVSQDDLEKRRLSCDWQESKRWPMFPIPHSSDCNNWAITTPPMCLEDLLEKIARNFSQDWLRSGRFMNPVYLKWQTLRLQTWLRCCVSLCVKFTYCREMCAWIKDTIGCNLC